jgi:hypothetical protein
MFPPEYGWFLLKLTITGKLPQKLPRCFSDVNQMGPDSPDCVFDASLVPGTCLHRFVDLKGFIQQVPGESDYRSATCKAAEIDCLERRNSIRPCVPSHVAHKAERGGNELFWSPWTMYPRSQERHRNREATVYLPA